MSQTQDNYTEWTLSEIRLFPFGFAPKGWVRCDGQILPINQNQALFSVIGITYGGDGRNTFALPDLRGRALLHAGNGYVVAKGGGEAAHALTTQEMAAHKHLAVGSSKPSDLPTPKHNFWPRDKPYRTDSNTKLHEAAIGKAGSDQPHDNMAPYLSLNYCIAITGIYPSEKIMEDYVGVIKALPMLKPVRDEWMPCNGSELSISQYQSLFSVIGNRYGGDGVNNFRIPDLRGKAMLSQGKGDGLSRYSVGQTGGASQVTLTEAQLPEHRHIPSAKTDGTVPNAADNNVWAGGTNANNGFASEWGTAPGMNPGVLAVAGGGAAHNNMMPYQVMMYMIAVKGYTPPREQ